MGFKWKNYACEECVWGWGWRALRATAQTQSFECSTSNSFAQEFFERFRAVFWCFPKTFAPSKIPFKLKNKRTIDKLSLFWFGVVSFCVSSFHLRQSHFVVKAAGRNSWHRLNKLTKFINKVSLERQGREVFEWGQVFWESSYELGQREEHRKTLVVLTLFEPVSR